MSENTSNISSCISVIIPANNEESCIGKTLSTLLKDAKDGELEVIVSCNGCSDQTSKIARTFPKVLVLEQEKSSKIAALNLADQHAKAFPRIYLDADILITMDSIRELANALGKDKFLAVSPRPVYVLKNCSWPVAAFYKVWLNHPVFEYGMVGAGVYALSRQGRDRFDQFPDVTADDGYIKSIFQPHERRTIKNATSTVFAPKTLKELIHIKTRSRRGSHEISAKFKNHQATSLPSRFGLWLNLLKKPQLWIYIPIYIYVVSITWNRVRRNPGKTQWERSQSDRESR